MNIVKLIVCGAVLSIFFSIAMPTQSYAATQGNAPLMLYSSDLDFATVRSKALEFIKSKGLTVFAEFDHAKNAKDVGLQLAPNTVIVFGSPQVGTKLMQEFTGIGMVLPLKILITQSKDGKIVVAYENLTTLFAPYGVKADNQILQKMSGLLKALATTATK